MTSKKTLGVFFGSRSCEHDVSVISALQLIRNIDKEKYDVVPVYISHDGTWYTGSKLTDIKCYTPFDPYDKDLTRVSLDMTAGKRRASPPGSTARCWCYTVFTVRMAPCRACSS